MQIKKKLDLFDLIFNLGFNFSVSKKEKNNGNKEKLSTSYEPESFGLWNNNSDNSAFWEKNRHSFWDR